MHNFWRAGTALGQPVNLLRTLHRGLAARFVALGQGGAGPAQSTRCGCWSTVSGFVCPLLLFRPQRTWFEGAPRSFVRKPGADEFRDVPQGLLLIAIGLAFIFSYVLVW